MRTFKVGQVVWLVKGIQEPELYSRTVQAGPNRHGQYGVGGPYWIHWSWMHETPEGAIQQAIKERCRRNEVGVAKLRGLLASQRGSP